MTDKYVLTPKQIAALQALNSRNVEASAAEIAVSARLLPSEAKEALAVLQQLGLVNTWIPVFGPRPAEQLFVLNDEGRIVWRTLEQFSGSPPVGAVIRLQRPFSAITSMLNRQAPYQYVEVASAEHQTTAK